MASLIGTNAPADKAGALKLKSVMVTPRDAAIDTVQIFPYGIRSGNPLFTVKASNGVTGQVFFDDVPLSSGVTVVPTATCEGFVVEYGE